FVPFLYTRTTNKKNPGSKPPPPIIDLTPTGKKMWNDAFWMAFKTLALSQLYAPVKAPFYQGRQNESDYRKAAIARAMALLSLYESVEGEKILTESELQDIQARMWLSDKMFGSFVQPENLQR